ncbi:MAG: FAD-binding protein [Nocardiopsaceae bacterium]|nr:FAD-binding protein [Nocardiopsaceae bacterium]
MTAGEVGEPLWRRDADVVVVGSGTAGISAALSAAASGASVLVITKDLAGGASPLAQGGLAAAIGSGDTASAHAADTVSAGAGLCEPDVVAALAAGAPGAVEWLVRRGAELERRALRLEGGHGAHRIVHSGDDATGAEVHRALLEALIRGATTPSRTSRVQILDRVVALDLAVDAGRAEPTRGGHANLRLMAATIGPGGELDPGLVSARAVILAAGGLGQAYAITTNPPAATGDALAIAARAGAVLRDPEFVQFHPTVLWLEDAAAPGRVIGGWPGNQRPLITEALRGAGAVLRDLDGRPLMAGHDPRGDLAPRDVVAARVHSVITAASGDGASGDVPGHVWLDATALGADVLENGFPTVTAACRKHDVDPVTDLIPVAPGAHYSCGGIRADLDGHTSLPGLYAVGEAASTGVHGANRLASNSLVEAVITGRRAGQVAASGHALAAQDGARTAQDGARCHNDHVPRMLDVTPTPFYPRGCHIESLREGLARGQLARGELAAAMSRYAGVLRDAPGLNRLLRLIAPGPAPVPGPSGRMRQPPPKSGVDAAATRVPHAAATPFGLDEVEAANLRLVSELITAAALHRTESRGCHRRGDAPGTAEKARHTLIRQDGEQIRVTWEDQ